MWELDCEESWVMKNWCFWTVLLEKTPESPLDCKEIQLVHSKGRSVLGVLWKEWCNSWNSRTLATSCEELTHWKSLWCWEGLDDRGWDGWMASPTWWTWVWVNSRSWWWTGRPGMLQFMGSQRVGHDWVTQLNWGCTLNRGLGESNIWAKPWRQQGGKTSRELGEEHSRQREQPNAKASRQGWTGMQEERQADTGGNTRRRDGPDWPGQGWAFIFS